MRIAEDARLEQRQMLRSARSSADTFWRASSINAGLSALKEITT